MKFKTNRLIIISLLSVLLFSNCENRQKLLDILTARSLGIAYLEENKLQEAEEQFKKLIELAPDEALGYTNLGLVHLRLGQLPLAEEQFNKALKIEPNDPDIRLNLSVIYELESRRDEFIEILKNTIKSTPDHIPSIFKLAQIYNKSRDKQRVLKAEKLLKTIIEGSQSNITARLILIENLLKSSKADDAKMQMEELRRQLPEMPKESMEFFEKSLAFMSSSETRNAVAPTMIFHNLLKPTPLYAASSLELQGLGGLLLGTPRFTFSRDFSIKAEESESIVAAIRFTDVTKLAGLDVVNVLPQSTDSDRPNSIIAAADYDGDGDADLYISNWNPNTNKSEPFLFRNELGRFENIASEAGIKPHAGKDLSAIFSDYDNDGYPDIFITNTTANHLYHNLTENKFRDIAMSAGIAASKVGLKAIFADFDHEGDLDLYLANSAENQFYRNNSDDTFTELSEKMGISAGNTKTRDIAIGDFDEDGDLDFFIVNEDAGNILYTNLRQGRFQEITETSGLNTEGNSGAVTAGDYNNDGFLDLFVTGLDDGNYFLYKNQGNGTFAKDSSSTAMFTELGNFVGFDAQFFDFDNDGSLDLLVAGQPSQKDSSGLLLFHNDGSGKFASISSPLPKDIPPVGNIAVADFDDDGDMDIFLTKLGGGVRLLRNDGGNANKYLKLRLAGLRTGNGKNNHFGVGSKVELKAGELYQMRLITEPETHFGLGQHQKADVLRILWQNGVPQNSFFPGSDQVLVEKQVLKGSCAFLYTWNGKEYTFVKDLMWRSALGMPLGIMGGSTAYAFSNASEEYLKVPGDLLKEKDGKYTLQITEELWETAYFDELKLVVVDHPDSIGIYADERFVPPPFPPLHIYEVNREYLPATANDEFGNNLLPMLEKKDHVYVSNLTPTKYQGVTEMHDLILELSHITDSEKVELFLNGWLFPTDASINVSISQSNHVKVISPYLQVINKNGEWQTVMENLGFPMGKNKTVIADLSDKFLTDNFRIRIRTNMEIYWDYVFYTTGKPSPTTKKTILQPTTADLHYRGFSRVYRKGGRYGPHWFDYKDVSTKPKWRDLIGNYTRFGDVEPLLRASDNKYIIMNSGDEVSVEFDAKKVPTLKKGWTRDYLIYTVGWIKDGDLNTAHGKTVAPLPFHEMSRYPYGNDESYPDDESHQRYLDEYNTREVTIDFFLEQLRDSP